MSKKNPVLFLGEPLEFFISWCLHFFFVFISSRFHFFLFLFLQMFLQCLCRYSECDGCERAFFYFTLLHDIWHNLLLSRLTWDRQFSLASFRAFHWSLKHKLGASVCLNHIVFGKRFYLVGSIYVLEVATNFYINPLSLVLNSLH